MKIYIKFMILLPLLWLIFTMGCKETIADIQTEHQQRTNVNVQNVKAVQADQEITYSGTIAAYKTIPLGFSVSGTVKDVFVSEGDEVKKGRLLAELNPETYKNSYTMALASRKQAEDAFKRLQTMYRNGNLPEIKMIDIATKAQQAKASAAIAKKKLDDCRLYAASEGIVGKRSIEIGQNVIPGVNAITIVKIEEVYARISVTENEISRITIGNEANIVIPAIGSTVFRGKVKEIGVMGDPLAHTYKVGIIMANTENSLKPGMICNVRLHQKGTPIPLMVPMEAVMIGNDGKRFVYTVDGSGLKASKRYVTTGRLLNDGIEVIEGLKQGEQVVTSGQHKLWDTSAIQIVGN